MEVQMRGRPLVLHGGVEEGANSPKRAESLSTSDTLCLHTASGQAAGDDSATGDHGQGHLIALRGLHRGGGA